MKEGDLMVTIAWHANPFRGDRFEAAWRPAAAAALDYGARWWSFLRSQDDPLDFLQGAIFESKADWDRYWFSEQLSEARTEAWGYFQVPVLPLYNRVVGAGELERSTTEI